MPRIYLILLCKTDIQPFIQYGPLIFGCCSYTSLLPIVKLQRKIVGLITFKRRFSSVENELVMYSILSVYEFYAYKLLKFVLKSNNNLHSEKYLNNLFVFSNSSRNTQSCCRILGKYTARNVRIQYYLIHSKCVKLFNTLQHNTFLNIDVCFSNCEQLGDFFYIGFATVSY